MCVCAISSLPLLTGEFALLGTCSFTKLMRSLQYLHVFENRPTRKKWPFTCFVCFFFFFFIWACLSAFSHHDIPSIFWLCRPTQGWERFCISVYSKHPSIHLSHVTANLMRIAKVPYCMAESHLPNYASWKPHGNNILAQVSCVGVCKSTVSRYHELQDDIQTFLFVDWENKCVILLTKRMHSMRYEEHEH